MAWILDIIVAVLKVLVPALIDEWRRQSKPTAEDAAPAGVLADQLRRRVIERWGKAAGAAALAAVLALGAAGCAGSRTIYVKHGDPVRLRETVRGARVWVLDAEGKPTPGEVDLPEGWYCLPVEGAAGGK